MSSLKLDQESNSHQRELASQQLGFGLDTMINSKSNSGTNFYSNSVYKPSKFNSPEKPEYFVSIATTQMNLPIPDKSSIEQVNDTINDINLPPPPVQDEKPARNRVKQRHKSV